MAEAYGFFRIVEWFLVGMGWLMLAATMPSRSAMRILLALTAAQSFIGFLALMFVVIVRPDLSLLVRDILLTPVLLLLFVTQIWVMYRGIAVKP